MGGYVGKHLDEHCRAGAYLSLAFGGFSALRVSEEVEQLCLDLYRVFLGIHARVLAAIKLHGFIKHYSVSRVCVVSYYGLGNRATRVSRDAEFSDESSTDLHRISYYHVHDLTNKTKAVLNTSRVLTPPPRCRSTA